MGKRLHCSLQHISAKPCKCGWMLDPLIVASVHTGSFPFICLLPCLLPAHLHLLSLGLSFLLTPHSPSSLLPTLSILQYVTHNPLAPSLSLGTDHLPSLMPKLDRFHEIQYLHMQIRIQHPHFPTSPSPSLLPPLLCLAVSFFTLYDTPFPGCLISFPTILIFSLLDKIYLAHSKHSPNI